MPLPSLKDKALLTSLKTLKQVRIKMVALLDRTCTVQYSWPNMSMRDELWLCVKLLLFHVFLMGKTPLVTLLLWRWFGDYAESCGMCHSAADEGLESLQRAFTDPMTAPTSTDGCALLEGGSAGHSPVAKVLNPLFLPCNTELAVVDPLPPGVHHSLVQHHGRGSDQSMGSC